MLPKNYKRRQFIQTTASFSAGLAASLVYPHRTIASDDFVEAIVIGSGFGGAIAALRLGQAGVRTLIIERGRRWPITSSQNTFATFNNPDGRAAWLSPKTVFQNDVDVYTGVFETLQEDGIIVVNGAGWGGGSLAYNAITYQPKREIFYQVFSPEVVNYDELASVYYPRVQKMLKPSPIPPDVLATSYYGKTRFFMDNAQKAGLPSFLLDLALDWDTVRQEINGTKAASVIDGQCWWGVNSGAKNSLDKNYLPQAEKTGYVNVVTLHIVTEISKVRGEQKYRVHCTEINESGGVIRQKTFTCRYLFLAAGSVGTSKLLVKAKAKGTLPNLNNHIGRHWGTNGDNITTRTDLGPVTGNGGTAGAAIELLTGNNPIVVESLELGINPDGVHSCLGLGIPRPAGKFQYNPTTDSVGLRWPTQADNRVVRKTERLFEVLDASLTGRKPKHRTKEGMVPDSINSPTSTNNDAAISGHPLGGAVMGKACDPYGRVYGNPGLYVVDGALIPGSTACTNPSFTIAALAERCLDRIIAQDIKG
ncbi:GMC oxidoreductase [Merismopedia glauca]|uniref:Cholesterol oxidase n=1 Tax=Merismopedia glauca CCAP 1448/3 TaxID=1296344 RepID=A0A2T1BXK0_9CYAN|nr:GMC oxidoreductase [Merismopedia glauca]PSB00746.1 GMC family oxidoreductase [Merismopedia glauca CCAP 1448/3]